MEQIERLKKIRKPMIEWYQKNKRELSWRKEKNPYHIWISEIMLQQTRIEAVKQYYERFLKQIPTIQDLAEIEEEKLATKCGYFPTFSYHPETKKFTLYSKNINFDLYDEFLSGETRYSNLKKVNPEEAKRLLKENKEQAIKKYRYYQSLENKETEEINDKNVEITF